MLKICLWLEKDNNFFMRPVGIPVYFIAAFACRQLGKQVKAGGSSRMFTSLQSLDLREQSAQSPNTLQADREVADAKVGMGSRSIGCSLININIY